MRSLVRDERGGWLEGEWGETIQVTIATLTQAVMLQALRWGARWQVIPNSHMPVNGSKAEGSQGDRSQDVLRADYKCR